MEYKNISVPKTIAFVLIATILMETVTAAPLLDDSTQITQKARNTRQQHQKKKNLNAGRKKSLEKKKVFDDDTVKAWQNPCNSIAWNPDYHNEVNYNESYKNIKVSVQSLNTSLSLMDKINTSDIKSWEQFNNESYSFLPTKPGGLVRRWHMDTQIYVASFSLLYKYQLQDDNGLNNNTVSPELKDILERARQLLCDIEHFVNATSNRNRQHRPYWYEEVEMAKLVKLKKKTIRLNNKFVKGRFQHYISKLYKRIKDFKLEKNLEPKALKPHRPRSTLRPRKNHRKGNKLRTTLQLTGEPITTDNTFIFTTRKPRRKNTKNPQRQRKMQLKQ